MRRQTTGEEIANSISHGAGLAAAAGAAPYLFKGVAGFGNTGLTIGAALFAAASMLLYLASTIYHALPRGQAKRTLRTIEHAAIFILIAATYTPFTLGVLGGGWGWSLFGLTWGFALAGVALKVFAKPAHPGISTGLYLVMGWLALLAIKPLYTLMPMAGFSWLVAGGAAYTTGVIFYANDDRLRYGHFVWHLFVLTGNVCHYLAIIHAV
ncbi:MAG: hemolysin III family protein [Desulfurivibrionaceae bacterium]|nr:hemolysin III family protein [Desulfobulbales bacterium]MDT8334440.1 hemolysin III family protein [Desulfurivibrionaceae bacterium]